MRNPIPSTLSNRFVNQLMLGQPLYGSTGPPAYDPLWMPVHTWIFAAQYFMEIYNGTAKAAAGPWFNCSAGDILWTSYALDESWVWNLGMGVVGDPSRTSTLVVERPFMGLLPSETTSWKEPAYSVAHFNGCWELYGVATCPGYPSATFWELHNDTQQDVGWNIFLTKSGRDAMSLQRWWR